MITIFNRKELAATYSMPHQAALREALASAGIDYRVRVIDRAGASMSRARTVSFGQNPPLQYILYVHKCDWERARQAIRNVNHS